MAYAAVREASNVSYAPAAAVPAEVFAATRDQVQAMIDEAIGEIELGEATVSGLARLCATLVELEAIVERDPGIAMAADDLYQAAATLVGPGRNREVPVLKQYRLLKNAEDRLRSRLATARPSGKAGWLSSMNAD